MGLGVDQGSRHGFLHGWDGGRSKSRRRSPSKHHEHSAPAAPAAQNSLGGRGVSTAPAKLEYWRQEVGNLCPNHREERLIVGYRVGNIREFACGESRAKHCEIGDISCVALRYESGGFAQCEGFVELLRGKFQDMVAVCPGHGEDKISLCGHRRSELSCGEVGHITTQLLEDARSIGLNRLPCDRAGAGTRCCEVLKVRPSTVGDSESFRRRRTTNVSSADEQYVQSKLLV